MDSPIPATLQIVKPQASALVKALTRHSTVYSSFSCLFMPKSALTIDNLPENQQVTAGSSGKPENC
jgi:hypothetical protein